MPEDAKHVRAAARRKLLVSSWLLVIFPLVAYLIQTLKEIRPLIQFLAVGGAVLCTPFFMHLLELITGVPFSELSNRWDSLKGWQRGVIGITVCAFLFTILILMMGTILPLFI